MAGKRVCENCSGLFTEAPIIRSSTPRTFIYGIWTPREFLDKRGYPNTTTEILDPCTGFNGDIGAKYYGCKYNYETRDRPTAKHNRFVKEPRNTVVEADTYDCVEREWVG
jgi:hypothetical protein